MPERLQKILSQWGVASRRQAEQMILNGRVQLNGTVAQLGQKANPEIDRIEVDGQFIQPANRPELVTLLLHKPLEILSTCHDPWQRPTVLQLLPQPYQEAGLHPVGRLDRDTTGALLLTNDGRLTFCLTHPRHHIPKTYQAWVQGHPAESVLQHWRDGIILSGRPTLPAKVQVLERLWGNQPQTHLEIVLREGRNRQIRRVAEQLSCPVIQLHRTAIGPIQLQLAGEPLLPQGSYRSLILTELEFLQNLIGIMFSHSNSRVIEKECQV